MFDFGKIYDVKEIIEDVSLNEAKKVFYNKQILILIITGLLLANVARATDRFFVSTSNPHTFTGDPKNISFHLRKQYRHIPPTGYYVKGFWVMWFSVAN